MQVGIAKTCKVRLQYNTICLFFTSLAYCACRPVPERHAAYAQGATFALESGLGII